jgi:transposase
MQAETLLSIPPGVLIADHAVMNGTLYLLPTSTRLSARCPLCLTPSSAQHRSYYRTFRDVPCGGYALRIQLRTRRFFCRQRDCTQRIFTERFASFLPPRARMTERFRAALLAPSAITAHEAAQRLACLLHLPTSVTTLGRELGRQQPPVLAEPTKIGIDDFAFCKGKTYGTMIVDLESGRSARGSEQCHRRDVASCPSAAVPDSSRSRRRICPGGRSGGSSSCANCRPVSSSHECRRVSRTLHLTSSHPTAGDCVNDSAWVTLPG